MLLFNIVFGIVLLLASAVGILAGLVWAHSFLARGWVTRPAKIGLYRLGYVAMPALVGLVAVLTIIGTNLMGSRDDYRYVLVVIQVVDLLFAIFLWFYELRRFAYYEELERRDDATHLMQRA